LDITFVFTANPEDYTNRGSIVTPLKDRIGSQILTHYPPDIETGKRITAQEAGVNTLMPIHIPELARDMIEQVAREARESEFVDSRSGVSARLTISAMENLVHAAERRILQNDDEESCLRFADLYAIVPAINGKVELVYEGEQEGSGMVALNLIGKACRRLFLQHFPDPEQARKSKKDNPYARITSYFSDGKDLLLEEGESLKEYRRKLDEIPGLDDLIFDSSQQIPVEEIRFWKEFILFGLSECSLISKKILGSGARFSDLLSDMMDFNSLDSEED
jgi:magnesium chelatase subunit I